MALTIHADFAGQVSVHPRIVRIVDNSSTTLSQITAVNYLYNSELQGFTFYPTDIIAVSYNNRLSNGLFVPSISGSTIILSPINLNTGSPITNVVTVTSSALASAGKVVIQPHTSSTSQFVVLDVKVLKSTGLSGGGGDRLLAITDGTLVFNNAGITAALLGTPIFTIWGGTGNPINVATTDVSTAGADIYFQYTGGATDYTAGSVQIAVTLTKVTP